MEDIIKNCAFKAQMLHVKNLLQKRLDLRVITHLLIIFRLCHDRLSRMNSRMIKRYTRNLQTTIGELDFKDPGAEDSEHRNQND